MFRLSGNFGCSVWAVMQCGQPSLVLEDRIVRVMYALVRRENCSASDVRLVVH